MSSGIDLEQLTVDRPNEGTEIPLKMLALGFKAQDGFYLLFRIPITDRALVCVWPSRVEYQQAEQLAGDLRRFGIERSSLDYCKRFEEYPTMRDAREALGNHGAKL